MKRKPFFFLYYGTSILRLIGGMAPASKLIRIFWGREQMGTENRIQLRKSGAVFFVRGTMDVWSVKETWLDQFYQKCGFKIEPDWTVVDIGAGIGEFTLFAGRQARRVIAFEPYQPSYAYLEKNIAANQAVTVEAHPIAVASFTGDLVLDLSGGEPLQIQSGNTSLQAAGLQNRVACKSLADIFKEYAVERCSLMKLDCEGAEYDILFGTPPEVLARIDRVVMEYHDEVTSYSHKDLARFLEQQGYEVEVFANPVYREIGYLRAWKMPR